ncbi:hypothetical protein KSF73_06470 [Burkholderiaceae bacterium DAT-1]|nr:hypothetical protein [Burkholderiaceae bacterium DAT-1]
MLTDLIIARPDEADTVLHATGHATIWSTMEMRGVDAVKLCALREVLKGAPERAAQASDEMDKFQVLATEGDDGPWIHSVPADLVDVLAALPDTQFERVAKAWAEAPECKLDRWQAEDLIDVLRGLNQFAENAQAQGKGWLLWVCE